MFTIDGDNDRMTLLQSSSILGEDASHICMRALGWFHTYSSVTIYGLKKKHILSLICATNYWVASQHAYVVGEIVPLSNDLEL